MKNKCRIFTILFLGILALLPVSISAEESIIGILDPTKFNPGIGCTFWSVSDQKHQSIYEEMDTNLAVGPWMNIGSKEIKLIAVGKPAWPDKTRKETTLNFSAENLKVIINLTLGPNQCEGDDCVGVTFEGSLSVVSGDKKQTVLVSGGCSD